MPQVLWRIAAIEKRRLENGGSRKGTLNPGGIDLAAGLFLQISVAADVVGIGVGMVDGSQVPAVGVENLAHLAPGILIVAAVYEANLAVPQLHQADFGGTFNIIAPAGHMLQFKHPHFSSLDIIAFSCYYNRSPAAMQGKALHPSGCRVRRLVATASRNALSCSTSTMVGVNSSSSVSSCIRE